MKRSSLDYLVCPTCHSRLYLKDTSGKGAIESGIITCQACQRVYPIKRGIPHFIDQTELEGLNKPFARMYDWFSLIYTAFSRIGLFFLPM